MNEFSINFSKSDSRKLRHVFSGLDDLNKIRSPKDEISSDLKVFEAHLKKTIDSGDYSKDEIESIKSKLEKLKELNSKK